MRRSHRSSRLLIFALAIASASAASAAGTSPGGNHNRYKWHDAAGNLHYADVLPPEAAKFGYEVVSPQGVVVKHVERAKTADEIAAAKISAAKAQAEREDTDKQTRTDTQLLTAYPTEADLKRAHAQRLEVMDQQVNAAQISLRSQEQTLADMLARAAEAELTGVALPGGQAKQLAEMRKQVDEQRIAVARKEGERDQASARFDGEAAHYRELQQAKAEQQP
ncbi:MAG TPA: DUF4124 domain-containing protein [Dokdonella sp.]